MPSGNNDGDDGIHLCVVVCCGEHCGHEGSDLVAALKPVVAGTSNCVLVSAQCLQPCQQSPVVVVQGRAGHARPITVALSPAEEDEQAALGNWIADGGPGVAPMPRAVDRCAFAVQ